MQKEDVEKNEQRKRIYIALAGSMVALGSATIGYMFFGLVGGLGFVLMIFGFMWYLQTQLESVIESIEIQIKQDP